MRKRGGEPLRGDQVPLPLDWLLLDAGELVGKYRGGALMIRLLAAERRRRRVRQTALAARMGVSQSDVSKLETGSAGRRQEPRLSTILRYAAAAGLEQSYVHLAFTVVQAAELANPSAYEQVVAELHLLTG